MSLKTTTTTQIAMTADGKIAKIVIQTSSVGDEYPDYGLGRDDDDDGPNESQDPKDNDGGGNAKLKPQPQGPSTPNRLTEHLAKKARDEKIFNN